MVKCGESCFPVVILLLTLLIVAWIPQVGVSAAKGPREDDLQLFFYSDVLATYDALEAGDIDVVGFDIQWPLYLEAIANPNIALAPVDDMGMYEFDLNNNYSIPTYPGIRSPTSYTEFRQALAFLVDKDRVVEEFCNGFATRLDQPIAPPAHGWMNHSYTGANYPYQYDPVAASALLDATGWVQGTTPNPYYDATFPGSTEFLRTYPPDHETAGADIDPLITYVRTDDPRRFEAGNHLGENARKVGIPMDIQPAGGPCGSYPARETLNYHIHTGGWGLGRFPTFPYFGYHTDFWEPWGSNYVTGFQADNLTPAHPELDTLLERLYYADTFEQAYENCQLAMGLFTELCVSIPLFSARSYWAYSTALLGVVNMDSYSLENDFFFMNVYKLDGSPIRWGLITPPNGLNNMYSSWTYDYQCLNRVYRTAGYDLPPYNIAADQPGFVLEWSMDTWDDNGTIKSWNVKQLRSDSYFVDTSGDRLELVDVDAYLFSCYLQYAAGADGWNWPTIQGVKRFTKVTDYRVEIYYDTRSYWLYTSAAPYLWPPSIWKNQTFGLTVLTETTFVVDTNLTTPGFLGLDRPVWISSITSSMSGLLTEWMDYHWELGDWYIDTALASGETVTVIYYAFGDASGFTLGGNSGQDVTMGCGQYYMTGFSPGEGGFFTVKRNPFYWMETPVLGEVDFRWEAGGYYEVTIFDVVKAASAYDSQGIAVPDDHWFPGADVAPPGGVIDIFDLVTIASQYGQTFGALPP